MGGFLQFDRFTLDLARTALRFDDREVFPRRKVFEVLRHLAESGGHVVEKSVLFERVWPGMEVTDDVLVQCVRELRQLLGDKEHKLIRTVHRRGYLLDADVTIVTPNASPAAADAVAAYTPAGPTREYPIAFRVTPAQVPASALNGLFSAADAQRVELIAREKALPIPRIEIDTPDEDIPPDLRRFVGVWVSSKGFVLTNRQFMLIVSHVEKEGLVGGYTVRGPPAPNSRVQSPAEAVAFTAYIADGVLTYSNPRGSYRGWFVENNSLIFHQTYVTGDVTMVALQPVWTLCEAERGI